MNAYNPQMSIDKLNEQINSLERMRNQLQQPVQPTNLTQNFQIAPTNRDVIKYANSIEEVQRDMVIGDTPYFSKDMSVVWIKNTKGDIKTYELNEIVPKDEKDMQIALLQSQIEELRKEVRNNEQLNTNVIPTEVETNTTSNDKSIGEPIKENKSSSIQRVSTSKKK
jgi:hypothetical protein